MAGAKKEVPKDWPGIGREPSNWWGRPVRGEHYVKTYRGHYSYMADVNKFLNESVRDRRSRESAFRVFTSIFSHVEYDDCLPDGEPFASVSNQTIMKETGFSKNRVKTAIRLLTDGGRPLEVVWKPSGAGRGTCYRFNEVVAPSARQRSIEWGAKCSRAIVGLGEWPVDEPPDKGSETEGEGVRNDGGETNP